MYCLLGSVLVGRVGLCTSVSEGHTTVLEHEGCRVHKMMCAKDIGRGSSVS